MKKIFTILFCCLSIGSFAQIQSNATGATADFGTLNNLNGLGTWLFYGTVSRPDTSLILSESADAIVIQGKNIPVTGSNPHIGFTQRIRPIWPINMSNPVHMVMKVRFRSTGSVHPQGVAVKVVDTAGKTNICYRVEPCHMDIIPTNEFQDYYLDIKGKWFDQVTGPSSGVLVDSSAVLGYDFFIELGPQITNLSQMRIEIDYIQLGSNVDFPFNTIKGKLFNDGNNDCIFNGTDIPIEGGLVRALPGPWYAMSDEDGNYVLNVDTSLANINVEHLRTSAQTASLLSVCPANDLHTITMTQNNPNYCCYDFAERRVVKPDLHIDISSNRRRRCFRNFTSVKYSNDGNITATGTEIKVVYPQYVVPISSMPPWTRKEDNVLYYEIGDLPASALNYYITIIDSVICGNEEIRSLTQCTEAYLSANNLTVQEPPAWDRSSIKVSGKCVNGVAVFQIMNAGSGDMNDSLEYRVFLNDTLIYVRNFKLNASEYFEVEVPAGLNTIRLEADQHALHPGKSRPRATVEGCVALAEDLSEALRGMVMNVPQDDRDEEVAISCMPIADSYDPNDKQASPEGQTDQHYVRQGTELTYKIRFENTGTDTAYTVVVIDTLDVNFDFRTLKFGASSHPYKTETVTVDGQLVCKFRFDQINLTAKAEDSIKSQGFIQFSIQTDSTLSDGIIIQNEAGIYFDYNSPIITNTVTHTMGEYIETDFARASLVSQGSVATKVVKALESTAVKLYPNPNKGEFLIDLPKEFGKADLMIYTMNNQTILSQKLQAGEINKCSIQSLEEGIYYYQVITQDGRAFSGKVIKQ